VIIKILSKILHIIGKFSDDSFSQFFLKPAYNWTAYKWNTTVLIAVTLQKNIASYWKLISENHTKNHKIRSQNLQKN